MVKVTSVLRDVSKKKKRKKFVLLFIRGKVIGEISE